MKALRIFGKFLISVGVGILLFVAWTLWGTGYYTQQQQTELEAEFNALPLIEPEEGKPAAPPPGYAPAPGDPVFRLEIPKIKLNWLVVEGVGTEDLKKGPGHYPGCREGFPEPLCLPWEEAWPGQDERVIVSGHRTTYGRLGELGGPFFNIDKLAEGDEIITRTKWGTFTYEVTEKRIVQPNSLAITIPSGEAEIVLTTCNPKYSAAQRLIVFGKLVTT